MHIFLRKQKNKKTQKQINKKILFSCFLVFLFSCFFISVKQTNALVGITPSHLKDKIEQNEKKNYQILFLRSEGDLNQKMTLKVNSNLDFIHFENQGVFISPPKEKELKVPFIIDATNLELREYEGIIYFNPEFEISSSTTPINGNFVKVMLGAKINLTIERETEKSFFYKVKKEFFKFINLIGFKTNPVISDR